MRHNGERRPVDQSIDYLRSSGANEFVQNLGGSVKSQPLPVALVGIGIAWLCVGQIGQSARAAAAPRTRQEDELMGAASDRLTERAKEIGRQQLEKVEQGEPARAAPAGGDVMRQNCRLGTP